LDQSIQALKKASDTVQRASLEAELAELDARVELAKHRKSIFGAIKKMQTAAKYNSAILALGTNSISRKSTELNETVVSEALKNLLNKEFAALGAERIKTVLERRTSRGQTTYKLRLVMPMPKEADLSQILSEGEQRAIAIGSFLAEVNLGGGDGGVIFDDPVSSLDHVRREKVAARLVSEARRRQVILFTHDLYFLSLILEIAAKEKVTHEVSSVESWGAKIGLTRPEIPFKGKSVKDRVGQLRDLWQKAEKTFRTGSREEYEALVRDGYQRLRDTWERAVEQVLFNGVFQRFTRGLETQKLSSVAVENSDFAEISQGMSKCSRFAHDEALPIGSVPPEPAEFKSDIDALEQFRKRIEERMKDIHQQRKVA
jgi:hypothetical protein